ncbi:hypothetical protein BJY16_001974 [Actinoplanes octamycinicus]|uniref:Peptidase S8/S53 domain-containing protein n=1 Tax=Actinoplanes octamycinicus TaxID=135948 RepID=A0A7W7GUF3_9ACTN|nr:S8 family serine peptidase [Actinoplanes octamycinicus]MBB4738515.1 hypothetical protein [Actinoplanes octamycinicus]GIE57636.1 hypothetical protein Aoc01nite_30380 [Actinoplanes octamycinicus]
MSASPGKHRYLRRLSPRAKTALFASVVVVAAGVTIPAFAGDGPTVELIVGLKQNNADSSAQRLLDKGYKLRGAALLEKLAARTIVVPADEADSISAVLEAQKGVDYVEENRTVVAAAAEEPSGEPATVESTGEPAAEESTGSTTAEESTSSTKAADTPPPPNMRDVLTQIAVPAAWETATTWSSPVVAVVDTGVNPVGGLADVLLPGESFMPNIDSSADDSTNSHGTAMASLVNAACPTCKILPVKALDMRGTGEDDKIAPAVEYAADQGAKVINLSLGYQDRTATAGQTMQRAIDYARGKGAVVIASAGNSVRNNEWGVLKQYPAANPGVLGVGGINTAGGRYTPDDDPNKDPKKRMGTNYGADWVDLAAPYCAAVLTGTGATTSMCGTSVSTALASAVAGLVRARTSTVNLWTVENALTSTAVPPSASDKWVAFGTVRADRAVGKVDTTAPKITDATPAYLTKFRGTVSVTATGVTDTGGGYLAGSGILGAALYADGAFVGSDYTAPYAVNYNSGTRNGVVKLQWKVWDKAANLAVFYRNIVADNTKPSYKFNAPANNAKVGNTVKVTASTWDGGSGVYRAELWINNKLIKTSTSTSISWSVDTRSLGKTMKVSLGVRDKVGNVVYSPVRTWKK